MPPIKKNAKIISNSWKNRKRTGGIRRKCLREYENIKKSICANPQTTEGSSSSSSDPSTNQVRPQSIETGFVINNYESTLCEDYESIQTSADSDASSNNFEKSETKYEKNLIFRNNLKKWAINKNISLEALRELLAVVNHRLPGVLPVDPRTLLETKRNVVIKKIDGGEYWHKGLIEPLKDIINFVWPEIPESIQLNLNFDGLPIFNSSKKEFWPILCNIYEKPEIEPLVVGIYYGSGKPKNLSQYLEDFVAETQSLLENGISIVREGKENIIVNVRIRCFICDSPARAFIKDCLHLQLYRDPKDRYKKGQTKASLSLQQFLGFESGFTLDKESNTIAIICQDVVVVLAFETRERLIAWQVKVGSQLGSSREFLVLVGGGGGRKLPAGPARLHLRGRRFAITSGVPPRLLGLWELAHLRRYGVVEGRFCFEGGSLSGKGEGLHVLITDKAQEITDDFDLAARGDMTGQRSTPSRKSAGDKENKTRPSTRLSDFNTTDQSLPDTSSGLYEENFFAEDCGRVSPYWLSDERRGSEDPEFRRSDIEVGEKLPWGAAEQVTLERCNNCLTKLGVSRSSTVALSPTSHFNPAWTMEVVPESNSDSSSNNTEYLTPRMIRKTLGPCHCKDKPPVRPPKPGHLESKKLPASLPSQCSCVNDNKYCTSNSKVGPYENYDIPKPVQPVTDNAEYYDTPKRIRKAVTEDLFQVTKSLTPGSLVLKKNCGCVLKFASKKKPVIVECEEIQPVECPCQKVTNWANNLISLPYCKKEHGSDKINTEILTTQKSEAMAIYATVDVTRKTNRQSAVSEKDNQESCIESAFTNYQNIEPASEHEGPYANYENLEFALSLEYYENAKDLLKKAGVTQKELDALSANVELASTVLSKKPQFCKKCGHTQNRTQEVRKNKSDEYLLMEPSREVKKDACQTIKSITGYTPMSPNPNWSQSLKYPGQKLCKVEIEKSLSIPALNGGNKTQKQNFEETSSNNNNEAMQKRSCSVDSARLLEDLKEFDSSIGSHATSSSLETLRNMAIDKRRTLSPCDDERECYDCCKSFGSENKTSEESSSRELPHLRNKLIDNAQIKRSSSVPCKSGGNRDSSSSNDSGVSSCSMKHGGEFQEFEMPLTSGHSRYHYMIHKRMRGNLSGCLHSSLPRKSKSSDLLREQSMQLYKCALSAKSSSAEAEVPVLPPKQFKGVLDTHSTSSGTSDMSDYIETLSLSSSHSSSDTPSTMRISRQPTNTLRPRSGKEYHNLDPIITSMYKTGKDLSNYTNIP